MCGMDMRVRVDKVIADDSGKLLGWVDRILLGEDVGCLLLGIGRDYHGVVCFGVADML